MNGCKVKGTVVLALTVVVTVASTVTGTVTISTISSRRACSTIRSGRHFISCFFNFILILVMLILVLIIIFSFLSSSSSSWLPSVILLALPLSSVWSGELVWSPRLNLECRAEAGAEAVFTFTFAVPPAPYYVFVLLFRFCTYNTCSRPIRVGLVCHFQIKIFFTRSPTRSCLKLSPVCTPSRPPGVRSVGNFSDDRWQKNENEWIADKNFPKKSDWFNFKLTS